MPRRRLALTRGRIRELLHRQHSDGAVAPGRLRMRLAYTQLFRLQAQPDRPELVSRAVGKLASLVWILQIFLKFSES